MSQEIIDDTEVVEEQPHSEYGSDEVTTVPPAPIEPAESEVNGDPKAALTEDVEMDAIAEVAPEVIETKSVEEEAMAEDSLAEEEGNGEEIADDQFNDGDGEEDPEVIDISEEVTPAKEAAPIAVEEEEVSTPEPAEPEFEEPSPSVDEAPSTLVAEPKTPTRPVVAESTAIKVEVSPRSSAIKVSELARQLQSPKSAAAEKLPVPGKLPRERAPVPAAAAGPPPPAPIYDSKNTINAALLIQAGAFRLVPLRDVVPYAELRTLRLEDGVDPTRREDYLSPDEFLSVFGASREDFAKLPAWRRQQAKKKACLF